MSSHSWTREKLVHCQRLSKGARPLDQREPRSTLDVTSELFSREALSSAVSLLKATRLVFAVRKRHMLWRVRCSHSHSQKLYFGCRLSAVTWGSRVFSMIFRHWELQLTPMLLMSQTMPNSRAARNLPSYVDGKLVTVGRMEPAFIR